MTVTVVLLDAHTEAIKTTLAANSASIPVGRGEAPAGGGWAGVEGKSAFTAYFVLHPINASFDGPVADSQADLEGVWQVTAVGANQQQCEQAADVARTTLRRNVISITGRTVSLVQCEPNGARPDHTIKPVVWISTDRYRITTTPSP